MAGEGPTPAAVIDGFSPNLNKKLHAGHLKNLAVASALSKIAGNGSAVAMLGASQGVQDGAVEAYKAWCDLAQYHPTIYLDTELPPPPQPLQDGTGDKAGCKLYEGVVVYKSDGKPTYAAHDLSFAAAVAPTHYLTGVEQKAHFQALGLGQKTWRYRTRPRPGRQKDEVEGEGQGDWPPVRQQRRRLGGPDARRSGRRAGADPQPKQLAWNILAWQFNSTSLAGNTSYNLAQWAKPQSPGLYVTYTYAKVMSALAKAGEPGDPSQMSGDDVRLAGYANYFDHFLGKARQEMQPSPLAHFAVALAKKLANAYGKQKIAGGPKGFIHAVAHGAGTLKKCMEALSMYPLASV